MTLDSRHSHSKDSHTTCSQPLTVAHFFKDTTSTAVSLIDSSTEISKQTLIRRSLALASRIAHYNQQNWALACDNASNFIVGMLALMAAGKTLCLPANSKPGTLGDISQQADILLTDGCGTGFNGTCLTLEALEATETSIVDFTPRTNHASLIFFTSGSSGQPKAIVKKLTQLEHELIAQEQMWGDRLRNTCILACVSHQHIYGVLFRILWPLLTQRPIDCNQYDYPEQLLAQIQQQDRVAIIASPAQLERLPEELDWTVCEGRVKAVFSSGAPLGAKAAAQAQSLFTQLPLEVLGSTETGGVAWRQQDPTPEARNYWQTLPGVSAQLNDGLLQVFSPWLDEPETGFIMGDRAEMFGTDRFLLKGRADLIAKIEGKRVSLTEMALRLNDSVLVKQAEVIELEGHRKQLGAVLVLTETGQSFLDNQGRLALSRALKQTLANYFETVTLPRKWRYLSEMPVNTQGKLIRSELSQLFITAINHS